MNLIIHKRFLLILVAFSLAITASGLTAQVYKTVDEDGNVVYTDQPPKDGSKPIELRPISVIEAPVYENTAQEVEDGAEDEDATEMPLAYLRKHYKGFAIVAPQSEQSIWQPDQAATVAWTVPYQLQKGMQVTVFVDGRQQASTSERIIQLSGLDRGQHTLTAELKDAKNRRIATAAPVTFFIRRPSVYTPRPSGGS